jgi:transposase
MRKFEEKSLRKISKETGHDFETVKKYVEKEDFNQKLRPKQKRKSKLSPYKELVTTWLVNDKQAPRKQHHTAKRVYDRLKELYGNNFSTSERSVRKFVADIKTGLQMNGEGFLPLEHPQGEAQADFGEAQFVENGTAYDGYYLNISYPYSNGGHAQLFKASNQECLLEGMKAIFEHNGGSPTAIRFDNMSTAVTKIRDYGKRDLSKGFLRFMMHYGFQSSFCNPNSGHEKGSVENKVGYHRRNLFVPVPEFKDLKEYNKELLLKCDRDMDREHYKGRGLIKNLFLEEKQQFNQLPKIDFEVFRYEIAKADNYGKVHFDAKIYSTSPRMFGRQVMIKAGAYDISILDENYNHIITHKRLYGKEKEIVNWLPYLELMSKRPAALKYSGIYNQFPAILKEYMEKSDYDRKKKFLKLFAKMAEKSGIDSAIEAFEKGTKLGVNDPDSIKAVYSHLNSETSSETEINLPQTVPELKKYTANIKVYDEFILAGGQPR